MRPLHASQDLQIRYKLSESNLARHGSNMGKIQHLKRRHVEGAPQSGKSLHLFHLEVRKHNIILSYSCPDAGVNMLAA